MLEGVGSKILPVFTHKEKIVSALKKFPILILVAETGSGKTIFIPYILKKNFKDFKIIVTQTRRIAAISAAKFLARILNQKVGEEIGYIVRFDNFSNEKTEIKFVTDGIFFQELVRNPLSLDNTCLILDEFHERTVHTDLILSLIKKRILYGKNIKVILMSASGDSQKLARFFGKRTGKIKIPGKLYQTTIYYTKFIQKDYIGSVCSTIFHLHSREEIPGDILVFLPGQEELEEVFAFTKKTLKKNFGNFIIVKLFASLTLEKQALVFTPTPEGLRKIILATNVAESSITIPGTKIVVDCGFSKQKISNWKTGISLLRIFPISKSEAIQRAGRSSREEDGKCFRLFRILDYKKLSSFPRPDIQKVEITSVILQLFCFLTKKVFEIDLIDWPPQWEIKRSLELLLVVGAINSQIMVTPLGKLLSIFPLDIKLSRCIIEALKDGDSRLIDWVLTSSSILSVDFQLKFQKVQYEAKGDCLGKSEKKSDQFFLAYLFFKFQMQKQKKGSNVLKKKINPEQSSWESVGNLRNQLKKITETILPFFCVKKFGPRLRLPLFSKFCFCYSSGFFLNSAKKNKGKENFSCISSGLIVEVHSSTFFKSNFFSLVIFHEIFVTKKIFIRYVSPVIFSWLIFFGKKIFI